MDKSSICKMSYHPDETVHELTIEISYRDSGHIHNHIEAFRAYLFALGFAPETINEYVTDYESGNF